MDKDQFDEKGFIQPIRVLDLAQVETLYEKVHKLNPPKSWNKGLAITNRAIYNLACHPLILERLHQLLGKNLMLWGSELVIRKPGMHHRWHADAEHLVTTKQMVNVWIPLENSSLRSCLRLIPRSHNFKSDLLSLSKQQKVDLTTDGDVMSLAKKYDDWAYIHNMDMSVGDAVFFSGRLWHSSINHSKLTRTALLLSYASTECQIKLWEPSSLDSEIKYYDFPKPPCLLISGDADLEINYFETPPSSNDLNNTVSLNQIFVSKTLTPTPLNDQNWYVPNFFFEYRNSTFDHITCHVSNLRKGNIPHEPHTHVEEEILIVLKGEASILSPESRMVVSLKQNEMVYYPSNFSHTIKATSEQDLFYLMFKWRRSKFNSTEVKPFSKHELNFDLINSKEGKYKSHLVFNQETNDLYNLHCHLSAVEPGGGYLQHIDSYDVVILLLEGSITVMNKEVSALRMLYIPSGLPHDLHNSGDRLAKYIVFEFHGNPDQRYFQQKGKRSLNAPIRLSPYNDEQYITLQKKYTDLINSDSLRIGRSITAGLKRYFSWLPYVAKKVKTKTSY